MRFGLVRITALCVAFTLDVVWGELGVPLAERETAASRVPESPLSSLPALSPTANGEELANGASTATETSTTEVPSSSLFAPTAVNSVTTLPTSSARPTALNGTFLNGTDSNSDPNALPFKPEITPAFAVAGVVLILAGSVHTLIGIKNKWIQIFLSVAFLTSLAVTVLIVYLMDPPIKNTIQGAYFVAVFFTGVIFGSVSLAFREVTEGFGCILGGFSFSMWIMCMRPGGLIQNSGGKAAFIGLSSFASYLLSFSHHTRPYGLMGSTSFSGATAVMLGIDCFSRAGLKEFWVYVWDLNRDIFPLHTHTYPVTRGIRVELAGNFVVCLIGIISQMKLWKVIKERRAKQAAEREEEQRKRDEVEEEIGRRLERSTKREKKRWENVYAEREQQPADSAIAVSDVENLQDDSGSFDTRSTKGLIDSEAGHWQAASEDVSRSSTLRGSPQAHFPNGDGRLHPTSANSLSFQNDDVQPSSRNESGETSPPSSQMIRKSNTCSSVRTSDSKTSPTSPATRTVPPPPEPVPLPFAVPSEALQEDNNSSVAASIADSEHRSTQAPNLTHRYPVTRASRASIVAVGQPIGDLDGDHETKSCSSSVQVIVHEELDARSETFDSDDKDSDAVEDESDPTTKKQDETTPTENKDVRSVSKNEEDNQGQVEDISVTPHEPKPPYNDSAVTISESVYSTTDITRQPMQNDSSEAPVHDMEKEDHDEKCSNSSITAESADRTPSVVEVEATPKAPIEDPKECPISPTTSPLTPGAVEKLPSQTSRIVSSYRTNEWAKHLSEAEAPELDSIEAIMEEGTELKELPAPVIIREPQPSKLDTPPLDDPMPVQPAKAYAADPVMDYPMPASRVRRLSAPMPTIGVSNHQLHRSASYSSLWNLPSPQVSPAQARPSSQRNPFRAVPTIHEHEEVPSPQRPQSQSMVHPLAAKQLPFAPYGPSTTSLNNSPPLARSRSQASLVTSPITPITRRASGGYGSTASSICHEPMHQLTTQGGSLAGVYPNNQTPALPHHRERRVSGEQRAAKLATFRNSVQADMAQVQSSESKVEHRRVEMMNERYHTQLGRQQQAAAASYRDSRMDYAMRRGNLQDLHNEAMRRMQATANKHISKPD